MNLAIELTGIVRSEESAWISSMERLAQANQSQFRDLVFDEDDLERPAGGVGTEDDDETPAAASAPTYDRSNPPPNVYYPVTVFENDIREFYARRGNRTGFGTRIVYRSGAARLVRESYDEVKAKFAAARGDRGEVIPANED